MATAKSLKVTPLSDVIRKVITERPKNKFTSSPAARIKELESSVSLKDDFPKSYSIAETQASTTCAILSCDDFYNHKDRKDSEWKPSIAFSYYNQLAEYQKTEGNEKAETLKTTLEAALENINKFGICENSAYKTDKKPTKTVYNKALKSFKPFKFYNVASIKQIQQSLSNGNPVIAVLSWTKTSKVSRKLLVDLTEEELQNAEIGNAVVIIGYDDKKQQFEAVDMSNKNFGTGGNFNIKYSTLLNRIWWNDSYSIVE